MVRNMDNYKKLCIELVLSTCLVVSTLAMSTTNFTTDQLALLSLKQHITSDPGGSILGNNWSTAVSVCEWIGVTCSPRHPGRVTQVNISNMGLAGTIPADIGNLSFLVSLDMRNNNFHGVPPERMVNLRRLRYIDLRFNNFVGEVPSWFGFLDKLQSLLLSKNQFSGVIPKQIGNLYKLEHLRMPYNNLEGGIPKEICNLTMLKSLVLCSNHLTGSIPQEIGNLIKLENLCLQFNSLTGSIPIGIFNISALQIFSLVRNHIIGNLPPNFGYALHNLEEFVIGGNNLSGVIPRSISNCSKLARLSLGQNKFTGKVPNSIGDLRLLEVLDLSENDLTSDQSESPELSLITSLTYCKSLTRLALAGNPLNGMLPVTIGNLSNSLEKIYARSCRIRGSIPESIGNLSNLIVLSIFDNALTGSIPSTLKGLQKLQGLLLYDNNIEGTIPTNLCNLPSLSTVDVSHNQISGTIPECIGNLTSLRNLHLGFNRLASSLPRSLWNLKDLLKLNLTSNVLIGSLPPEIGKLEVVMLLDLSVNRFSDSIPSTIGALENVIRLSLARNAIQGSIPESLSYLLSLEFLDLSHNNLSGSIPKSLEALKFLKYFNVSFNDLRGEIPSDGPFQNFNPESFISNAALCGASRFHVKSCETVAEHRLKHKRNIRIIFVVLGTATVLSAMAFGFLFFRYRKKDIVSSRRNFSSLMSKPRFSYNELFQATDGWNNRNLLGLGSFGSVYKGTFRDGIVLAIKVFNLELEMAFESFDAECEMLSNFRHRNLTKVITCCSNADFKAIVLEYMPNGSLENWLYSQNHFLDATQRLTIMIDVAYALHYLHHGHSTPMVHCDLKPSNILLSQDMVAHLCDFGISKLLSQESSFTYTQTLATCGYVAPEYGSEGLVSTRCDVYSYGIVLMEVFTRKKPNDEMFGENLSLKSWILDSLPNAIVQVIDDQLD
ncbi:uncharacterized protein [Coffea arabica]|uniref:Uncharacterized protein isoform X1 n=1 Tax=Coffea arabica TaxID=13443 RepID=A0ABM4W2C5_COFAR